MAREPSPTASQAVRLTPKLGKPLPQRTWRRPWPKQRGIGRPVGLDWLESRDEQGVFANNEADFARFHSSPDGRLAAHRL